MFKRNTLSFLILILIAVRPAQAQTDPYHKSSGGFGYMLAGISENIDVWWCEGAYKVMLDTPLPLNKAGTIELFSAANEYEPFQLVIKPGDTLQSLKVDLKPLISKKDTIKADNITLRRVEYVNITRATDSYGYEGMWPDPLPEETGSPLLPDQNNTLWFTIFVPPGTQEGKYKSEIVISSGDWRLEVPVSLTVWDFELPSSPTVRSGFGLSVDKIADYHNPANRTELEEIFDLYMQAFRDYGIAPYSFYYLYQPVIITTGIKWKGGFYDPGISYEGKYSLKVTDREVNRSLAASHEGTIEIEPGIGYMARWYARSDTMSQQYHVLVRGYDHQGNLLVFENRMDTFTADTSWKPQEFSVLRFNKRVKSISLELIPSFSTPDGETTGTVWFDKLSLVSEKSPENLLPEGDFEVDIDSVDIKIDFIEFDRAAERYLDRFGFNSFRLNLEGMGSGTYYSRNEGTIAGFMQGSEEYSKLMGSYLSQVEQHLDEKGWLGKEYIYWFDEPGQNDYPFVREGMELIKSHAPRLTTFLTENDPGPEIMDVTDITCTIFHRIDPQKAAAVAERGQQYWSYLCTAPKAPWVTEFIDHDAVNLRIWLWFTYAYRLDGILIWSSNYWTSRSASPPGYLQNPWEEPASYVQGYGWPQGKQTQWGNGDGRFFYPPNRNPQYDRSTYLEGPVPSLRLEFLRQGIEDYEYMVLLEKLVDESKANESAKVEKARQLLRFPTSLIKDGRNYTRNPQEMLNYRKKLADAIVQLKRNNN